MKKSFVKRTVSLFAAVLTAAVCAAPGMAAPNSVIDDARNSVVRVYTVYASREGYSMAGTGSAFIVHQSGTSTILVTNHHVAGSIPQAIDEDNDGVYDFVVNMIAQKVYIIPSDVNGTLIEPQVTILNGGIVDVAIMTTSVGLSNRPVLPLADVRDLHVTDTVYALGFPGAADDLLDNRSLYPSSPDDVTVTQGIVSKVNASVLDTEAFQTDCYINHGNSGGPMLNEDGAVIGVNTWGTDGVNYTIHISYIVDALNEMGVEYSTLASVPALNTEDLESPDPTPVPTASPGPDQSGNIFSQYWWAFLGVAAVAGIGLWILFYKRKAPATVPQAAPSPIPATVPSGSPSASGASSHLICSKGHFAGTTFPINGSLFIGRDPQRCQIVFPNDAKGISSQHCELRQQGAGVTLTDKGSTYGTFIAGGRKLNANESVTLKPGDSFYLADTKNEFKIL